MTRKVNGFVGAVSSLSLLEERFPASEHIGCSANVGTTEPFSKYWSDGVSWNGFTNTEISTLKTLATGSVVFVETVSDLPTAVNSVITLEAEKTYWFTQTVDLLGARLVVPHNTVILGSSSENSRIKSTGLTATALITGTGSLPMRGITIEAAIALDLDSTDNATGALDWFGVNFTDCAVVGTIANYSNIIWTDCALLNSANMTIDGTIGTVGFNSCLFSGIAGQTTITVAATTTITRRLRWIYSAHIAFSGATAINVSTSATIPVEGFILDTCAFSGGATYVAGVSYDDNKSLFVNNKGISNSAALAQYYMVDNVTATDIVTQGVAVKIAGTTTANSINQKFSHSNNRLTYTGALSRDFLVTSTLTITGATSGNQIGLYISKNGTLLSDSEVYITANASGRAEGGKIQSIVDMNTDDYIEIWIENASATSDVTVGFLNTIVQAIN
jgi:hypothetical protein